ncbi:hypothetical protein JCM10914A_44540 [Paenibacillus sp. JCM 10914]|nr:hypothetical protein [Paenibacillus sp. JCM 10914]
MKKSTVALLAAVFLTLSLSAYSSPVAAADEPGFSVLSDRQTGTVKP